MVQTHRDVIAAAKAMGRLVATVEGSVRLQPHVLEAATPRTSACNPTRWRLQAYVLEAATPCAGGCNPILEAVLKAATLCVPGVPLPKWRE